MMNTILRKTFHGTFILGILLVNQLQAEEVLRWETDFNVALTRAEQENRPLFIHFVGNDSEHAQLMLNEVFVQPNIAVHLNENFVMLKINGVENYALAHRLSVTGTPTDVVMMSDGLLVHRRIGVITAERFTEYLAFLEKKIQSGEGLGVIPIHELDEQQQDQVAFPPVTMLVCFVLLFFAVLCLTMSIIGFLLLCILCVLRALVCFVVNLAHNRTARP
jgi:thioredoxin-related protein